MKIEKKKIKEIIKPYKIEDFNKNQLKIIQLGIKSKLYTNYIKIYAKPEFSVRQMERLFYSMINHNLHISQIKICANPVFNPYQMDEIISGFTAGLSIEQVKFYAKPEFTWQQMQEIKLGFINKLSLKKIKLYAKPEYDAGTMEIISTLLLENIPIKKLSLSLDIFKQNNLFFTIIEGIKKGLTDEQILFFKELNIANDYSLSVKILEALIIIKKVLVQQGYNKKEAEKKSIFYVKEFIQKKLTEEPDKIYEITRAFKNNISKEKIIKYLLNNNYNSEQMREIRLGLEHNLSENLINLYINDKRMGKIRRFIEKAWKKGLNEKQIEMFIKNFVNSNKYIEKTYDEIMNYLKKDFNKIQIDFCLKLQKNNNLKPVIIKIFEKYKLNEIQTKLLILTNFKISVDIIKDIELKKDDKGNPILVSKNKIPEKELKILKEKLNINEIDKIKTKTKDIDEIKR